MSSKFLIAFFVTYVCFTCIGTSQSQKNKLSTDLQADLQASLDTQKNPKREFRAAWVTTFTNLDWPSKKGLTPFQQKAEFIQLVQHFTHTRLNAAIVQVRASSDAFYESKFSPWSEWLTGTQGIPPSPYYDPLEFMVKECHTNNLEFHAWFNPLRAISHDRFSSVAKDHITNKKPEWFFHYGQSYYYNPGIPEVRQYIIDVILEVVRNYDIDGVHLDDYFYPYTYKKQAIPDQTTFKKYARGIKNIKDWRRDNINLLIEEISKAIKKEKAYVKFGISPLAIWRNKKQDPTGSISNSGQTSYDNLYCDTKLWMEKGLMDYIAPQLYWSTDNLYANYNHLLKWWNDQTKDSIHLYLGHALYKLNKADRHSFPPSELINQVNLSRTYSRSQGSIFFRANAFKHDYQGFQKKFRSSIYKLPAIIPTMPWIDDIPPMAPSKLTAEYDNSVVQLDWLAKRSFDPMNEPSYYAVYRYLGSVKNPELSTKNLIDLSKTTTYIDFSAMEGKTYTYVITTFDRLHNESINFVSKTIKL